MPLSRTVSSTQPGASGKARLLTATLPHGLRLLRGEDLDSLSRELGVTAATLSAWQEDFLVAGPAGLKSGTPSVEEDRVTQLKTLIGELTIDNECLKALLRAHEVRDPLASRRSSR